MGWSVLGDDALVPERRWEPPPFRRGTFQIFFECFVTLLLCLWTALHLNISAEYKHHLEGRGKIAKLIPWKKCRYLLLGLIAPEVITAISIYQWRQKGILWSKIQRTELVSAPRTKRSNSDEETGNRQSSDSPEPGRRRGALTGLADQSRKRQHNWTQTHCWYATIGGFVFKDYGGTTLPFPQGLTRMALTPAAIEHIALHHPDAFPDMSESAIRDKSKANDLTKLIVCGQALWFCTNMLGRVLSGFPLTLLELNTAAHCICTLIAYIFWWNKPYDITEPTSLILTEDLACEAAFICLGSKESHGLPCEMSSKWCLRSIASYLFPSLGCAELNMRELCEAVRSGKQFSETLLATVGSMPISYRAFTQGHHRDAEFEANCGVKSIRGDFTIPYLRDHQQLLDLALRFNAKQKTVQRDPAYWGRKQSLMRAEVQRARPKMDWRGLFVISQPKILSHDWFVSMTLYLACVLYGAVHMLAWNGPFPSSKERTWWYLGSCAAAPYLFGLLLQVVTSFQDESRFAKALKKLRLGRLFEEGMLLVMALVTVLSPFFFVTTRAFLTVEPYLALGYAPERAFELPRWLSYVPHIG